MCQHLINDITLHLDGNPYGIEILQNIGNKIIHMNGIIVISF